MIQPILISVSSEEINIDLSSFHPDEIGNKSYSDDYILSQSEIQINIYNIEDDVGFLLVQVHTFVENITLSESFVLRTHSYVTGSNIGLIWANNNNKATFYLLRNIKVDPTLKILLVVNIYNSDGKI